MICDVAPSSSALGLTPNASDSTSHAVGFRRVGWNASTGFSLNGVPTKIRGNANHQDFAGVGVAVPDALQTYRVAKLQSFGANGWRTAHNAPTPALLDAADRLGMLVWDENHRNGQDDELRTLVLRDRHHPSIIIWSICNEKLCDTADAKSTRADGERLAALFHALDPAGDRVVSANYNPWLGPNTPLDLQGVDYATYMYDAVHSLAPHLPAISSETSSAVSDRGEYANNATAGHVRGYDTEAPSWGETAEGAWGGVGMPKSQGILTRGFMSGGFTWTGWDYKGEPTPYAWPDINSHFGILDIASFEKDRYFWYASHFKSFAKGQGMIHLLPHWNWAGTGHARAPPHLAPCVGLCTSHGAGGATVDVWAFTNGANAELFLNGKSLGVAKVEQYAHAEWKAVPYAPGNLTAVATDSAGAVLATQTVMTTGAAAALRVSVRDSVGDSKAHGHGGGIVAGCNDVALVQVEVVDTAGRVVPTAAHSVTLSSTGPATFVGGGNGDPACHVGDKNWTRPAFHGKLLGAFVSTKSEGTVTVRATAAGLTAGSVEVKAVKAGFDSTWWCARLPEV